MPSRKQRRRRAKSFRHDYEYVLVDEEGHEVELDAAERRAARDSSKEKDRERDKGKAASVRSRWSPRGRGGSSRSPTRQIQPPSWRRVGKRGLIFAPLMFVAVSVLDQQLTPMQHAAQTLFLLAFFLPFSYVMDTIAHRMYLKRTGQAPAKDTKRQSSSRTPR
jgi:hypothetical protein